MIIAEAVRRVIRKRRARMLPLAAAGAALLGGLISPLFLILSTLLFAPSAGFARLLGILWPTIYAVLAASTVYYRLKGIRV
jgi:hypothetical protein